MKWPRISKHWVVRSVATSAEANIIPIEIKVPHHDEVAKDLKALGSAIRDL